MNGDTDERGSEFVRRAVAGDEAALMVLLTESRDRLLTTVTWKIAPELQSLLAAEDVVQETHAEVFRRVGTFSPNGPDSFYRWVAAIAVRRLRSAIRRLRAAKRGGGAVWVRTVNGIEESSVALLDVLAGAEKTPSTVMAGRETVGAVKRALATLPAPYRHALVSVYIEGRPVRSVATDMGRSERAIHGLCRRGLRQLRGTLGNVSSLLATTG